MPTPTPPTLCPLPNLRFIEVAGSDVEAFLNAQLSRDVAGGPPNRAPLAAWHDSKGRVLALLRALRTDDKWMLLTHGADPAALVRQLMVFVLRADLEMRDASAQWRGAVAVGDVDHWIEGRGATLGSNPGDAGKVDGAFIIRVDAATAYLAAPAATLAGIEPQFSATDSTKGELAEIRSGLVNVSPDLAGRFSPQMLNLDRLGALAFDKGCYPGQEVIARIQNLGSVKRRVFRFSGRLQEVPPAGTVLIDPSGGEAGEILRAARADDQSVELLAVVKTDAVDERLTCSGEAETPLTKEDLPGEDPGSRH